MPKRTVVYDGDCRFCVRCKRLIEKLDWKNRFLCRPLQDDTLYSDEPGLTREACKEELKLATKTAVYGGADAVVRICRGLPLLFTFGWLLSLPPFIQLLRPLYRLVARNRSCFTNQKR